PDAGLAVSVTSDGGVTHRIDPFVGAGVGGNTGGGVGRPAPARRDPDFLPLATGAGVWRSSWAGEVYAEGGRYTMELRSDGQARLVIDQATVLTVCLAVPAPALPPYGG